MRTMIEAKCVIPYLRVIEVKPLRSDTSTATSRPM